MILAKKMQKRPVAQLPKGDKVDPGKKENQGDPVKQDRKSQEESHLFCAQSLLAQILIPRVKLGESGESDAHHDEQAGEEKKEDRQTEDDFALQVQLASFLDVDVIQHGKDNCDKGLQKRKYDEGQLVSCAFLEEAESC